MKDNTHRKDEILNFDTTTGGITKKEVIESNQEKIAIIYCRVSSKKQVEEGNGLGTQEGKCREHCESEGITVEKVFLEEGISGAEMNRKALNEAINYLKIHNEKYTRITHFVVNESSRLARPDNIVDALDLEQRIKSLGVKIIKLDMTGIDEETDEGKLMSNIKLAISGYEKDLIKRRTKDGRVGSLKEGNRPFAHVPVGYIRTYIGGKKKNNYKDIIDPDRESILREGLELFSENIIGTQSDLIAFFREQGLTMPSGAKIQDSFAEKLFNLHRLFFYSGYILYPDRGIDSPIEGKHDGIISLNTAFKIVDKLQNTSKNTNKVKQRSYKMSEEHPLRGAITCPHCKRKFTSRNTSKMVGPKGDKVKKLYPYYGCNNKQCEGKVNIDKSSLEEEFDQLLLSMKLDKSLSKFLRVVYDRTIEECSGMKNLKISDYKKRITRLKKDKSELQETIVKTKNNKLAEELEKQRSLKDGEIEELEELLKGSEYYKEDDKKNFHKLLDLFENPLRLREMGDASMREMLLTVRFNNNLTYKKNLGLQTDETAGFYGLITSIGESNFRTIGDQGFEPWTLGLIPRSLNNILG